MDRNDSICCASGMGVVLQLCASCRGLVAGTPDQSEQHAHTTQSSLQICIKRAQAGGPCQQYKHATDTPDQRTCASAGSASSSPLIMARSWTICACSLRSLFLTAAPNLQPCKYSRLVQTQHGCSCGTAARLTCRTCASHVVMCSVHAQSAFEHEPEHERFEHEHERVRSTAHCMEGG